MVEVAVNWHEILTDSKVNVISDSITMFRDILAIRLLYGLGIWSMKDRLLG